MAAGTGARIVAGRGEPGSDELQYCLVDIKEAIPAAAPAYAHARMPNDHAMRVVDGARHLSPPLGDRMLAADLLGKPVFLRELLPQDLKLEIEQLTRAEATEVAAFLGGVVGKAHARRMDAPSAKAWRAELRKGRSKTLDAPGRLWTSIVDLVGTPCAKQLKVTGWPPPTFTHTTIATLPTAVTIMRPEATGTAIPTRPRISVRPSPSAWC